MKLELSSHAHAFQLVRVDEKKNEFIYYEALTFPKGPREGIEGAPPCRGKRRPPAPGSEALRAIERAGGMEACQGCLLPSARPAPVLASPDGGSLTFSTICCHRLRSQ